MRLRTTSYALALTLVAGACGSEEAFVPQVGDRERELATAAIAQLGLNNETINQLAVVGDLDGDGIADAVVRTSFTYYRPDDHLEIGSNVYIAYGGPQLAGKLDVQSLPHLSGAGGFDGGVAAIGDVDGDGLADLLVTASRTLSCPREGETSDVRTGAYVVYGNRARLTGEVPIASVSTFLRETLPCTFVTGVTGLGDLDGDGKPDFAVGHISGQSEVSVFYGRGTRLPAVVDLTATSDARITWPGSGFIPGIARLGDIDGDGHDDFMLRDAAPRSNLLRVVRGTATRLTGSVAAATLVSTTIIGDDPCSRDTFASALGDLDGDGADDFAVLGCQGEIPGPQTISDRVFYGRRTGFGAQLHVTDADATLPLGATGYLAGYGNLAGGDVDGDGVADLVVGDANIRDNNGGVHILPGNGTRLAGQIDLDGRGVTYVGSPRRAVNCDFAEPDCIVHEQAGSDLGLADLTGDHTLDIFVEAASTFGVIPHDAPGSSSDRAYVLSVAKP